MNKDAERLDWLCNSDVRISRSVLSGEWRVYDYSCMQYVAFGDSSRDTIDNAMEKLGEEN